METDDSMIRVVVVEDDHLYRDLLRVGLSRSGIFEVTQTFSDGASCLREIDGVSVDAALLDIELPNGPNGIQVGHALRERYADLGIAELLGISVKTVERHIMGLYQALDVDRDARFHPRVLAVLSYLEQVSVN